MEGYQYDAFISYRHLPFDHAVAKKLQELLETYRPPKGIACLEKAIHVFRDQSELPTSGDLDADIKRALASSRYLIVICSEETKNSKWCMQEIDHFKSLRGGKCGNILTVLISGEPREVFPASLCREARAVMDEGGASLQETDVEPLAANIVAGTRRQSFRLLSIEFLRIAAPILGCRYDDLFQRHRRRLQKRRRALTSGAAAALLAGIVVTASLVQTYQRQEREIQLQQVYAKENERLYLQEEAAKREKEEQLARASIQSAIAEIQTKIDAGRKMEALSQAADLWTSHLDGLDPGSKQRLETLILKANHVPSFTDVNQVDLEQAYSLCVSESGQHIAALSSEIPESEFVAIYVFDPLLRDCEEFVVQHRRIPGTTTLESYDEAAGVFVIKDENGLHRYNTDGAYLSTSSPAEAVDFKLIDGSLYYGDKLLLQGVERYGEQGLYLDDFNIHNYAWYKPDVLAVLYSDERDHGVYGYNPFSSGGILLIDFVRERVTRPITFPEPDELFNYENIKMIPGTDYLILCSSRGVYETEYNIYDIQSGKSVLTWREDGGRCLQNFDAIAQGWILQCNSYAGSRYISGKNYIGNVYRIHSIDEYVEDYIIYGEMAYVLTEDACIAIALDNMLLSSRLSDAAAGIPIQWTDNDQFVDFYLEEQAVANEFITLIDKDILFMEDAHGYSGYTETIDICGAENQVIETFASPFRQATPFYDKASNRFGFMDKNELLVHESFPVLTPSEIIQIVIGNP